MQLMELASHAIALGTKGVKVRGPREEVVLARFAAACLHAQGVRATDIGRLL